MVTGRARSFWPDCGFELLTRDGRGRLRVTDDFLRLYLQRPELAPVAESCAAERALHAALLENPRRPVTPVNLLRIRDRDAVENWELFITFRDRLLAQGTIEDAYLSLFLDPLPRLPPLFADHLAQLVLKAIHEDRPDPLRLRAAELFFRPQKVRIEEGAVLVADEATLEQLVETGGFGDLGRLVREAAGRLRTVELDVLGEDNAEIYFQRSDRFDTVLDLSFTRPGLDALCRVLEAWLARLLDIAVSIQPLAQVRDERWRWHVGLDAEATGILNDLYEGREVEEERLARLLALFRMEFRDPSVLPAALRGRPVYLGMAMDARNRLRLKPQNLLVNLPLAEAA